MVPADCPTIFQTFDEADFPPALIAALKSQGFDAPTPIQARTYLAHLSNAAAEAAARLPDHCGVAGVPFWFLPVFGPTAPPRPRRPPPAGQCDAAHLAQAPSAAPRPASADHPGGALCATHLIRAANRAPIPRSQAATWPIAITMRDIVAVAKTGSGKTCGYLLPVRCSHRTEATPRARCAPNPTRAAASRPHPGPFHSLRHPQALSRIAKEGPVPPCKNELVNGRWETEATKPVCIVLAPTRELAIQIGDEANRFAKSVRAPSAPLPMTERTQCSLAHRPGDPEASLPHHHNSSLARPAVHLANPYSRSRPRLSSSTAAPARSSSSPP